MRLELVEYEMLAGRVWELRDNLTSYDASYVALAEVLRVPLATLDVKLSKAPGTTCSFQLPPTFT
jgi:predicted nucleic acid-binding protein